MHSPTPALTFGIAGHVDHGKTTLVRALTGIDTDRLAEEKRRGISIELGFAHLDLEVEGKPMRVGMVDMPGHERFVRRMIAGTAGIDAVVMVVAADEGVMPQGREHAAICGSLGVELGVIALTKVDLADEELLELVREDVRDEFADTFLASAPMLAFSSRSPERYLEGVRRGLARLAERARAARLDRAGGSRPFRLPVDRSFTMKGRGTVVTGTAATGRVGLGDVLRVWPSEREVRVRGIERHGETVERFAAPGRVALNLAGTSLREVPVGAVLAPSDGLTLTARFDAEITALPHLSRGLERRQRCLLHIGTTRVQAALAQLSGQPLAAGETGLAQIHLDRPLALAPGERFVARGSHLDPRHGHTIAGGLVLHPAAQRHRLGDPAVGAALRAIAGTELMERIAGLLAIAGIRGLSGSELRALERNSPERVDKVAQQLAARGRARRLGTDRWFGSQAVEELTERTVALVGAAHRAHPERPGLEPDELLRRLGSWLDGEALSDLLRRLVRKGRLVARGRALALPDFEPAIGSAREEVVQALVRAVSAHGLATPGPAVLAASTELAGVSRAELALAQRAALERGELLRVARDYHVSRADLDRAIAELFERHGDAKSFSTGDLKTALGLTRKHLIPLAEFLDGRRVTVRDPSGNRRFRARARQALADGRSPLG